MLDRALEPRTTMVVASWSPLYIHGLPEMHLQWLELSELGRKEGTETPKGASLNG